MHVAALVSLIVLAWIGYRYSQGRGALQQLGRAVPELREAWKVAPHPWAVVIMMAVTLLVIAIGLYFMPWRALLDQVDAVVAGLL